MRVALPGILRGLVSGVVGLSLLASGNGDSARQNEFVVAANGSARFPCHGREVWPINFWAGAEEDRK